MDHERLEQAPGQTSPSRDEAPKHTPGPWALGFDSLRGGIYWCVARGENLEPIDIHESENGEADARLIAAAPDLLAVAKEAFQYSPFHTSDCEGVTEYEEGMIFDNTKGCTCFLSRLRAAIAKAETR